MLKKYYVNFVSDYSKSTWVNLIKFKLEVFSRNFKRFRLLYHKVFTVQSY